MILVISHEITQKFANFSLKITDNRENCHSWSTRFPQMVKCEFTFTHILSTTYHIQISNLSYSKQIFSYPSYPDRYPNKSNHEPKFSNGIKILKISLVLLKKMCAKIIPALVIKHFFFEMGLWDWNKFWSRNGHKSRSMNPFEAFSKCIIILTLNARLNQNSMTAPHIFSTLEFSIQNMFL